MLSSYIILKQNEANLEQAINSASVVRLGEILLIVNIISSPIYLQTDSYHEKGGKKGSGVEITAYLQYLFKTLHIFREKKSQKTQKKFKHSKIVIVVTNLKLDQTATSLL